MEMSKPSGGGLRAQKRPFGHRNEVDNEADMDKMAQGIGKTEVATVPRQYAKRGPNNGAIAAPA
jgi:hypothetical protein